MATVTHQKTYRQLIKLYPRQHQQDYGQLMEQTFTDMLIEDGTLKAWLTILIDLPTSLWLEYTDRKASTSMLKLSNQAILAILTFCALTIDAINSQLSLMQLSPWLSAVVLQYNYNFNHYDITIGLGFNILIGFGIGYLSRQSLKNTLIIIALLSSTGIGVLIRNQTGQLMTPNNELARNAMFYSAITAISLQTIGISIGAVIAKFIKMYIIPRQEVI